ncbi:MAG: S-methyl-5-thioribose-1-phosphate isomerase [Candidatus Eisenbacteria bacterium]
MTLNLPVTVAWTDGGVRVLDQTLLPGEVRYVTCRTVEEAEEAIRSLRIRGAPAIGVMAGFTLALALRIESPGDRAAFLETVERYRRRIAEARPTAVNLEWALKRVTGVVTSSDLESPTDLFALLLGEAERIAAEDRELCDAIGRAGAALVPEGGGVLTHCNAGALATAGSGTALAPLYRAWEEGKRFEVFADETRPLLQGARLTAWELGEAGIPVTILCDGAAASLLASGRVGLVIVGADRIAANGDTANKIGTYGVALAAEAHGVPFYVAAPGSTFDLASAEGSSIPIEEREEGEIRGVPGAVWAAERARTWNPSFDVTPARYIRGFVTEKGILRPPFGPAIRRAYGPEGGSP